jgi:hypothetical protein
MLPDFAMRGGIALAGACCLILSACSPGVDYPSLFPAIHDTPPPRSETPLDSVQVQQATEDLISARDRLSAEAQSSQNRKSAKPLARPSAKSSASSSARPPASPATAAAARKQPVALSPAHAASRRPADSENAQDAGAETKSRETK